jgi:hypothetical protein
MLLPRKNAETDENAIERRLVETTASGTVLPFHPVPPARTVSDARAGLFLVKRGAAAGKTETLSGREQNRLVRRASLRRASRSGTRAGVEPCRVIAIRIPARKARREKLLGLMAALGPLLGLGHAALVWLRIV